jgi:RNA polymerase sigma factor (sigma-70 family)
MATSQMSEVLQHLRRAALLRDGAGLSDGQLLGCFIEYRDEAAFAALVRRHGPMVWGVCRRVLCNHHDAEDAFQATFLVLVRKAASVSPRERVANWLYGVAHQTALKARATATRKKGRERQLAQMPEPEAARQDLWQDLQPLLDEALSRLPDKYRAVVVLCDLEGKTRREAARQLGCPEGTVAGRLARARAMLAKRLARQGLSVSGGALAAVLSRNTASAGVPTSVASAIVKAACVFTGGQGAAGLISVPVATLTEGVIKAMLLTKLKVATGVMLAVLSLAAFGGGLLIHPTASAWPSQPSRTSQAAAPNREAAPPERGESLGYIKLGLRSEDYKAFFIKTLGVMAEYFEQISCALQYDGRIEAWKTVEKGQLAIIRQAVVSIESLDDGRFAIHVRINKILSEGDESKPAGRDTELERVILQRLNVQPDQIKEQRPEGPPKISTQPKNRQEGGQATAPKQQAEGTPKQEDVISVDVKGVLSHYSFQRAEGEVEWEFREGTVRAGGTDLILDCDKCAAARRVLQKWHSAVHSEFTSTARSLPQVCVKGRLEFRPVADTGKEKGEGKTVPVIVVESLEIHDAGIGWNGR